MKSSQMQNDFKGFKQCYNNGNMINFIILVPQNFKIYEKKNHSIIRFNIQFFVMQ
jgi:hypothetical protein